MSVDRLYEKDVAITGIGQSEIARPSLKSASQLTADACLQAIRDAGLQPGDINGIACWPGDHNNAGDSFSPIGSHAAATMLGLNVNWYGGGYEGPGPLAGVINGAMAIASGLCDHVLVFRTITESSARQVSKTAAALPNKTTGRDGSYMWRWYTPFKVYSAINLIAMFAQRHFHTYGTSPEQLAQIAMTCRKNAALNPHAIYREPMSLDDYMSSRMISTPLRMFDCDVHCDASTALVLSRRDRAKDQPNAPIRIDAIGAALNVPYSWDQLPLTEMATKGVGDMMWSRTDLKPSDVDTAQLYDGFSILTLIWLEGLGFCPVGEGGRFIEGGANISRDGILPINTNGGQLSGGRTHGLGYVHEACLQLWNRAGKRQLKKADIAVAAAGGGPLGGSLILVRD
jgi:acetyl-CoA acetyltransferase